MIYEEDSYNVRSNRLTIAGVSCGPVYNAVLKVDFSSEGAEPVTLTDVKNWLRIDISDDDTLITSLITAARAICENHANLSFIPKTVTAKIKMGLGDFTPPYGPVNSITSAKDKDSSDIDNFDFDNCYAGKITVVYTAGYTTLPGNLRNALLCQIGWMYENRGDARAASSLSEEAKLILNQVRSV